MSKYNKRYYSHRKLKEKMGGVIVKVLASKRTIEITTFEPEDACVQRHIKYLSSLGYNIQKVIN